MKIADWQYLQQSLREIDRFIRDAVDAVQEAGNDPTNTLRGLVITEDEVAAYLDHDPMTAPIPEGALEFPNLDFQNSDNPLARLVAAFGLTTLDSIILLLSLAPEFDLRYERIYAFLQDDVAQRHASVNLMMNLLGSSTEERFIIWKRLTAEMPLRQHRLINVVPDPVRANGSFLSHQIRVDHRVTAYLLGDNQMDGRLTQAVQVRPYSAAGWLPQPAEAIQAAMPESPLVYLYGNAEHGQLEMALALCAPQQLTLVQVDMTALVAKDMPIEETWRLALREAYLNRAVLYIDHWESALNETTRMPAPALWQSLLEYPQTVFMAAQDEWEPRDLNRSRRMLRLGFSLPDYRERYNTWEEAVNRYPTALQVADIEETSAKFIFTRSQIIRAVNTAVDLAQSRGELAVKADLYAGAQAHANLQLGSLARRIVPRFGWDDLILPPEQLQQLREMSDRLRYSHVVQDDWGYSEAMPNSAGISALFAGDSGTGKTLSAEVIAKDLGLVMYKIDLSAVVSKYIGETEKNLNTIFTAAQSSNAILFFDEADALFGKRSEVKDARDRYANIEIAYLLQQIEAYDGVVIMATNFRQNLDDAFTRRLDFLIDFPFPDAEYRKRLWEAHFPPRTPMAEDVNFKTISERYRLAGGNIRNVALAAAYLAAANGQVVTQEHIRSAIRRENQKMGRLLED
ncbi:MAG: ATP-binding protein [Chloroflexi bacterium]|nr:ATP-binding protein [Chloroflexota bacterium]MCC6891512.1 ATP-binding protein [Anaerolineae bacterium]